MPDFRKIVRERIAALRLEATAESDLTEELAQHLEDRYKEMKIGGATEPEAYQETVSELDDMYPIEAEMRNQRMPKHHAVPAGDTSRGNFLVDLWRDLRYTWRTMRKSPTFAVFVVLTLALGIGANTTVFTVINTLVLNPLPVPKSSELVAVATAEAKTTSKSSMPLPISYTNLKDYEAKNEVFERLAGYTSPGTVTYNAAGIALGLASIGLYGIMAYSVHRRQREIGVRMALGAPQKSVLRMMLKHGMPLVLTGVLIGSAASLAVGRLVARMLYGVSARDPLSVTAAAVVLLAVALLACYLPARSASRLDPLIALREE